MMVRKEYNRYSSELYCRVCLTRQEKKEDMRVIYIREDTAIKVCLTCLSILDSAHDMKTEDLK